MFNTVFTTVSLFTISILHLNICSSQHKLTDLTYYLENLNATFSFIGISETWATNFNNHILNLPNYQHGQCIRSINNKNGGTSLYINKDIQYKNRLEMGYYNVNTILETQNNPKSVQGFINMFSSYYYHKLINLTTRQINQSFSLLDNIYTNIPDCYNTCTSGVLKFLTQSDHYPIFTIKNTIEPPKPKAKITERKHSSKNIALFRKQIKRSDWGSLYNNENIEAAFSIIIKNYSSNFSKMFPHRNNQTKP